MKRFINGVEEGKWDVFLQDWVERRDGKKHDRDANFHVNFGPYNAGYEYWQHISHPVHLQAQSTHNASKFYEVKILTATRKSLNNEYPIVCLVIDNDLEYIEEFNRFGNSRSGDYKFFLDSLYFDKGDYIVTNSGTIGIYANSWYSFVSLDKDGTEHLDLCGNGTPYRMATEDEIEQLNMMLWVNNKRWNAAEFKLEDCAK